MSKEQKKKQFIEDLLSPVDLVEEYSSLLLEEGYDNLEALSALTGEELRKLGVKGGHLPQILKAIQICLNKHR